MDGHTLAPSLMQALQTHGTVMWLYVWQTQGSAPRDAGTSMWVSATAQGGTIGGGHLEQVATELARERLALLAAPAESAASLPMHAAPSRTPKFNGHLATLHSFPLGPALGQCCGGRVQLLLIPLSQDDGHWLQDLDNACLQGHAYRRTVPLDTGASLELVLNAANWPIAIFGAGHVGQALVQVLSALPCSILWIDSREAFLPTAPSGNVQCIESDWPAAEVAQLPQGCDVLVLTHSHALDFEICEQLLEHAAAASLAASPTMAARFGFMGLIGSTTKATTFGKRLQARGYAEATIARLHCPIGMGALNQGSQRKHPGSIAVSVAAQLLMEREAGRSRSPASVVSAVDVVERLHHAP